MLGPVGVRLRAGEVVHGFLAVADYLEAGVDVGGAKGAFEKQHIVFVIFGQQNML
jgi:hypothetical protein